MRATQAAILGLLCLAGLLGGCLAGQPVAPSSGQDVTKMPSTLETRDPEPGAPSCGRPGWTTAWNTNHTVGLAGALTFTDVGIRIDYAVCNLEARPIVPWRTEQGSYVSACQASLRSATTTVRLDGYQAVLCGALTQAPPGTTNMTFLWNGQANGTDAGSGDELVLHLDGAGASGSRLDISVALPVTYLAWGEQPSCLGWPGTHAPLAAPRLTFSATFEASSGGGTLRAGLCNEGTGTFAYGTNACGNDVLFSATSGNASFSLQRPYVPSPNAGACFVPRIGPNATKVWEVPWNGTGLGASGWVPVPPGATFHATVRLGQLAMSGYADPTFTLGTSFRDTRT